MKFRSSCVGLIRRALARTFAALLAVTTLSACGAWYYSAEPTAGWVIDKDTQRPIAGVVVVANWNLRWGFEGGSAMSMKILEATSDVDGRFALPGWGPEMVPLKAGFGARLKNEDPSLLLFHSNYEMVHLANSRALDELGGWGPKVRRSEWSGKRIALVPLRADDLKARARQIDGSESDLTILRLPDQSRAESTPAFCRSLMFAATRFHEDWSRARVADPMTPETQVHRSGIAQSIERLCTIKR